MRQSLSLRQYALLPMLMGLLLLVLLGLTPPTTAHQQSPCLEIDPQLLPTWSRAGGLPAVGYPISPIITEVDSQTGHTYHVQWFERMRLEHHPEHAPPYDVLSGLLGVERLQQLGVDWTTLPREAGPNPNCLWFAETGYNVCDQMPSEGFKTFWQSHGVRDTQIGDAHARSLALFGLPISGVQMYFNETTNSFYLVQWFEKARFEWHHDNAPHTRVMLGLLGMELQRAKGQIPSAATATPPCPLDERLLSNPFVTMPAPALAPLRHQLEHLMHEWPGSHAVSVTDLQTGETIDINGDTRQLAACTIKIPLMIAVAQDIEAGHYSAADVDGLVQLTMGPSNTAPARELLGIVGGGNISNGIHRVNAIMWDIGATNSILTHPPGYYWEELGYATSHNAADNFLTTNDLNLMLSKLYHRELLPPHATDYVLWSMSIAPAWMNQSLGGPLPEHVQFYHKIGQIYAPSNTWNDAGIVLFERHGQPYAYAISYLGSYGPSWEESYQHAFDLAAATWQHFSQE